MSPRLFISSLLVFSFLLSCRAQSLQNGDLVFVCSGTSDFDSAISQATKREGSDYSHVGLVERSADSCWVWEASPRSGVVRVALDTFLKQNGVCHFYRLKGHYDGSHFVTRVRQFEGAPYDFCFLPDNGRLYCSELVWESLRDKDGNPLFEARPMNFKSPDGTFSPYWTELFNSLGMEVPQGVLGTNPNDLARSKKLKRLKL